MPPKTRGLAVTDPDSQQAFYDRSISRLDEWRGSEDRARFRAGLRLARLDAKFGAGTIERAGKDANIRRTSAFAYKKVSCFLVRWLGYGSRRFYDEHPTIAYTHVRMAVEAWPDDIEFVIEALECAETESMTPDRFAVYIAKQKGKHVPPEPLFDQTGKGWQVWNNLRVLIGAFKHKEIRITIREVQPNGKDNHE